MQFDHLRRREFITLLGGAAVAWPLAPRAQQSTSRMPRIGIIDNTTIWDHFRQGLRDLGYVEGRNIAIEYRTVEEKPASLAAAATELARLPVDVIATFGTQPTTAAKQATTTIPIVMIGIGDPVRTGLVASLAHPGGKYHWQYDPGPRARGQTPTALQTGLSYDLACGFSLESK